MVAVLSKSKRIIILSVIFLLSFFILAQVGLAGDYGLDTTAKVGYGGDAELAKINKPIPELIGKIVGAGLAFIGVLFFILIIYGGFTWMLASGNEQQIAKAKDLIFAAVIGLVIILAAYAITVYLGSILGQAPATP